MKRAVIIGVVGAAMLLTGCSKSIDIDGSGATPVPGTSNLYRFCDGPTAIYFSKVPAGDDEYEFIVYDGCNPNATPAAVKTESLPDEE